MERTGEDLSTVPETFMQKKKKRKKDTTRKSLRDSRSWVEERKREHRRERGGGGEKSRKSSVRIQWKGRCDKQEVLIWAEVLDGKRQQWVRVVRQEISHLSLSPCTSLTAWVLNVFLKISYIYMFCRFLSLTLTQQCVLISVKQYHLYYD